MTSIRVGFVVALAWPVAACAVDHTGVAPRLGIETMNHVYDVPAGPCATAAAAMAGSVLVSITSRP